MIGEDPYAPGYTPTAPDSSPTLFSFCTLVEALFVKLTPYASQCLTHALVLGTMLSVLWTYMYIYMFGCSAYPNLFISS